jgi:hypothetical protein
MGDGRWEMGDGRLEAGERQRMEEIGKATADS